MSGKVIFVVTNHAELGDTGKKTGWYLPEVAHPYHVLTGAGYQVTFVSPKGGHAPMDPRSGDAFKDEPICRTFLRAHGTLLDTTLDPSAVNSSDYKALFYAGGHGPMFDLPGADNVAALAMAVYNQGGVLGAVCHGTVGFEPLRLSNGEPLVKGKKVTSFTNAEEDAVALSSAMPFLLESRLRELGADFVGADNWACNVQVDGQLVTGQNPASATKVGEEIARLIRKTLG